MHSVHSANRWQGVTVFAGDFSANFPNFYFLFSIILLCHCLSANSYFFPFFCDSPSNVRVSPSVAHWEAKFLPYLPQSALHIYTNELCCCDRVARNSGYNIFGQIHVGISYLPWIKHKFRCVVVTFACVCASASASAATTRANFWCFSTLFNDRICDGSHFVRVSVHQTDVNCQRRNKLFWWYSVALASA